MMNHPYISLSTKNDLSDQDTMSWLNSVNESGPPGIIAETELHPDKNPMRFYRRKTNEGNTYNVVLARNLNQDEVKSIVENFSNSYPDGDFEISYSQEPMIDVKHQEVQENIVKAIALEATKRNHTTWLNQKITEGWRFGQLYNSKQKVSPVLRDWENLSETYRKIEYQRMINLLEVLDEMKLKLSHKR